MERLRKALRENETVVKNLQEIVEQQMEKDLYREHLLQDGDPQEYFSAKELKVRELPDENNNNDISKGIDDKTMLSWSVAIDPAQSQP